MLVPRKRRRIPTFSKSRSPFIVLFLPSVVYLFHIPSIIFYFRHRYHPWFLFPQSSWGRSKFQNGCLPVTAISESCWTRRRHGTLGIHIDQAGLSFFGVFAVFSSCGSVGWSQFVGIVWFGFDYCPFRSVLSWDRMNSPKDVRLGFGSTHSRLSHSQ